MSAPDVPASAHPPRPVTLDDRPYETNDAPRNVPIAVRHTGLQQSATWIMWSRDTRTAALRKCDDQRRAKLKLSCDSPDYALDAPIYALDHTYIEHAALQYRAIETRLAPAALIGGTAD